MSRKINASLWVFAFSTLGFFLLVITVHAQDLPARPEAQGADDVQNSHSSANATQQQFTPDKPNSDAMSPNINAQPLPDKPQPVAREGQWISAGEDWPQFSDDLVMVARKNDGRMMWHVEKVNSCAWCGAPMTWKQAMFDRKSSSMWALRSALFVTDVEITHHMPCFKAGTCRDNPILGQSRLQAYSVGAGLTAIAWISEAHARKGDRNWRVGGYRNWWIVPIVGYATSTIGIITNLATWHSR
jgi:hypothetical protein